MASIGSMAANAMGIIEKGWIHFYDCRSEADKPPAIVSPVSSGNGSGSMWGDIGSNAMSAAGTLLSGGSLSDVTQNLAAAGVGQSHDFHNDENNKYFRVQFNPSTVRLTGNADDPKLRGTLSQEDAKKPGGESQFTVRTYTSLSIRLIFDAVDQNDAFLENKLIGTYSNPVAGVIDMGSRLLGKAKRRTVRPEVTAFIAASRNIYLSRKVEFIWGNMVYCGRMNSCTAEYAMFNPQGEPIRAYVDISLVIDNMPETCDDPLGIWRNSYNGQFSNNTSATSWSQRVGGILNF